MSSSRDDFGIAIRSALLRKGARQKFSLIFLFIVSVIIFLLDNYQFKIIKLTRSLINDGIYRLTNISTAPIKILPVGIAYDNVKPKFRDRFAICIEKPFNLDDFSNASVDDFNFYLKSCIDKAELKALKQVGRKLYDQLE